MNMMKEFDGKQIQQVFCIEEEKLKKYFTAIQEGNSA
jgi:hypothetical protein